MTSGGETPDTIAASPVDADARLRELESIFAHVERTSGIGYWRHVVSQATPFWSPGMYAMIGKAPGEVTPSGDWLIAQLPFEDRVKVGNTIADVMQNPRPFHYRVRGISPEDGRTHYFDTWGDVETDERGRLKAILGVCKEVTEVVEAEEALKRSEAKYRLLAEQASDMLARHLPDATATYMSPAVTRMLGYRPEELTGRINHDFVHKDDLAAVATIFNPDVAPGSIMTVRARFRHKDGHYIWVETTAHALPGPDGRIAEIVTVSRDIEERQRAEQELQRARGADDVEERVRFEQTRRIRAAQKHVHEREHGRVRGDDVEHEDEATPRGDHVAVRKAGQNAEWP
mgnify:CR=1 FL=1